MRWWLGSAVAIVIGMTGFWWSDAQQAMVAAAESLPVNFAHKDHQKQNCVACHHNFVDATGGGLCFDCHERSTDVAHLMETQFHDLCRNCHMEKAAMGEEHGPTRECRDCHVPDPFP